MTADEKLSILKNKLDKLLFFLETGCPLSYTRNQVLERLRNVMSFYEYN